MRVLVLVVVLCGCASTPTGPAARPVVTEEPPWPGVAWDHAEVVVFNQVPYGPGIQLVAYDARTGWNPTIVEKRPLTPEQARTALELAIATQGSMEVSKCAFPRHAVVFYAGQTPVGAVDICFTCEDILMWPDSRAPRDWDHASDADLARWEKEDQGMLQRHDTVYPRWQAFFRDQLALDIDKFKE